MSVQKTPEIGVPLPNSVKMQSDHCLLLFSFCISFFSIVSAVFSALRRLPPIRKKIEKELEGAGEKIFYEIHKYDHTGSFIEKLPEYGMNSEDIVRIAGKPF